MTLAFFRCPSVEVFKSAKRCTLCDRPRTRAAFLTNAPLRPTHRVGCGRTGGVPAKWSFAWPSDWALRCARTVPGAVAGHPLAGAGAGWGRWATGGAPEER